MIIGKSAGKSYAYLLGVYLGDGCVTKTSKGYPVFRLNTIDRDFAEATSKALASYTNKSIGICSHPVSKSSKPNHSLQCGDKDICRVLVDDTKSKTEIPPYVFEWGKNNKIAFVSGLMDSEGFVAEKAYNPTGRGYYMGFKSCDVWFDDFLKILDSIGVRYGKIQAEQPREAWYKTPRRVTIKMQSWVDAGCYFNISRKQDRVDRWKSVAPYTKRARFPRRLTPEANMQGIR